MEFIRGYIPRNINDFITTCCKVIKWLRSTGYFMGNIRGNDCVDLVQRSGFISKLIEIYGDNSTMNEKKKRKVNEIKEDVKCFRIKDVFMKIAAFECNDEEEDETEDKAEEEREEEEETEDKAEEERGEEDEKGQEMEEKEETRNINIRKRSRKPSVEFMQPSRGAY